MSKVERFEDLQVWQMAHDLSVAIYGLTRDGEFSKDWGLRDQIQRASVSVMSNIAEGFERYSRQEFKQFLSLCPGLMRRSPKPNSIGQIPRLCCRFRLLKDL